ncbi:MAG TPA: hypothetical protein VFM54_07630 [Micromonosporaceae bacterium]|nr:hypothetical protein [Micromonosporaceae bacterium]
MTGLSCFTANLLEYLAAEMPDAHDHLARSIRLAVRTDLPDGELHFSHHDTALDRLPDGTCLRYTGAVDAERALHAVAAELRRYGRVLVVTDSAKLPWSPGYATAGAPAAPPGAPSGAPAGDTHAPHFVLVDDWRPGGWRVRDSFRGLLPAGEQQPFSGWLAGDELAAAMTPPPGWGAVHRRRCQLAFGVPVPAPPDGGPLWLARVEAPGPAPELSGEWLVDDRAALPFLAGYFAAHGPAASRYLDDMWAAAQHRVFHHHRMAGRAYASDAERRRRLLASEAWSALPGALRFAVASAARGRPRTSLLHTTFAHVSAAEEEVRAVQAASRGTAE